MVKKYIIFLLSLFLLNNYTSKSQYYDLMYHAYLINTSIVSKHPLKKKFHTFMRKYFGINSNTQYFFNIKKINHIYDELAIKLSSVLDVLSDEKKMILTNNLTYITSYQNDLFKNISYDELIKFYLLNFLAYQLIPVNLFTFKYDFLIDKYEKKFYTSLKKQFKNMIDILKKNNHETYKKYIIPFFKNISSSLKYKSIFTLNEFKNKSFEKYCINENKNCLTMFDCVCSRINMKYLLSDINIFSIKNDSLNFMQTEKKYIPLLDSKIIFFLIILGVFGLENNLKKIDCDDETKLILKTYGKLSRGILDLMCQTIKIEKFCWHKIKLNLVDNNEIIENIISHNAFLGIENTVFKLFYLKKFNS